MKKRKPRLLALTLALTLLLPLLSAPAASVTFGDLDFDLDAFYDAATGLPLYLYDPAAPEAGGDLGVGGVVRSPNGTVLGLLLPSGTVTGQEVDLGGSTRLPGGPTKQPGDSTRPIGSDLLVKTDDEGNPLNLDEIVNGFPQTRNDSLTAGEKDFFRNWLYKMELGDAAGKELCGVAAAQALAAIVGEDLDAADVFDDWFGPILQRMQSSSLAETFPGWFYSGMPSAEFTAAQKAFRAAFDELAAKVSGLSRIGGCLTLAELRSIAGPPGAVGTYGAGLPLIIGSDGQLLDLGEILGGMEPLVLDNRLTDAGRDFFRNWLGQTDLGDAAGQTFCSEAGREAAALSLGLDGGLSWAQIGEQIDNLRTTLNTVDAADSEASLAAHKAALETLRDKTASLATAGEGGCLTMAELKALTGPTSAVKGMGAAMGLTGVSETSGAQVQQACNCGGDPEGACTCGGHCACEEPQ